MSLGHVDRRQMLLVCRYSLRQSLRSGAGLVFLLLALFFGLITANAVISPFEQLVAQNEESGTELGPEAVERMMVSFARSAVEFVIAPPESDDPEAQRVADERTRRWADYVLNDRPALLSAILLVMLFGTPLLIPFGAFNQTAGDIGNRGLRYLLLRTKRANIFYGRLLATVLSTAAVLALVVVTIGLYLAFKVGVYDLAAVASWSAVGLFALVVLSVPYVAVCAWLSASTDSAMLSLVISSLVIGGVLLGSYVAGLAWEPGRLLRYLLPWGVQNYLLAPGVLTVTLAAVACLAYAVVFTWLGARRFETRDL